MANKSFKNMAQRAINAEAEFIESLQRLGGITREEAAKVLDTYLEHKVARIDYGIGRVVVQHGAFLDQDTIRYTLSTSP